MVHVGVDLHKRSAQLAVLMPDGELTEQRLENDPERLERFLAQFPRCYLTRPTLLEMQASRALEFRFEVTA